ADLVGVDYHHSARQATELALREGTRELYLLEEDLDISPVAERIRGFRGVLDERHEPLAEEAILRVPTRRREASSQPWDPVDAYPIGAELASRIRRGAAVTAGNDYFALGLYRPSAEAGLRIPGAVRVLGHGDPPLAAYLAPP